MAVKQAKTNPASKYIKMLIRLLMNSLSPGSKMGQSTVSLDSDQVLFFCTGSGTMPGAAKKLAALPKLLNTKAMPVAVVRSLGGNHADETAEGAENTTMPAMPLVIAQM